MTADAEVVLYRLRSSPLIKTGLDLKKSNLNEKSHQKKRASEKEKLSETFNVNLHESAEDCKKDHFSSAQAPLQSKSKSKKPTSDEENGEGVDDVVAVDVVVVVAGGVVVI